MEIVKKQVSELKDAPYNPRINVKENPEFYAKLKRSIDKWGIVEPIVWNKRTGNVVGGNQRLAILRDNNVQETEVVVVDLPDNDEKALNIALNKVVGDWDMPKLNDLLLGLKEADYNIADTGFDDKELNEILDEFREVEEDDFELPKEAKYKVNAGDIFQLGNHRLMCGDSTKKEDVEKLMDGNKADMVFTDPPYGISIVSKTTATVGGGGRTHFKGKVGGGNIVPATIYSEVLGDDTTDVAKKSYQIFKGYSDKIIIWGGNYFTDFLPVSRCWLCWNKKYEEMASNTFADIELAWTSFDKNSKIYNCLWRGLLKEGEHDKRVHPTQKPIKLLGEILGDYTERGDSILDLFGGSGSTLIACEQTQRQCRMMEIDPYYCSVIIERWETFTGQQHVKINA